MKSTTKISPFPEATTEHRKHGNLTEVCHNFFGPPQENTGKGPKNRTQTDPFQVIIYNNPEFTLAVYVVKHH